MSLRCVGSQLLQTAPSPLLAGASTASLSIWVRVNPGSAVASQAGVRLFGDGGGKLAVALSAAGHMQVDWSSNDGGVNHASSWNQRLLPGVNYHLAATWRDGVQQYFLNGLLVQSDARRGALGKLGDSVPHPFCLGSDQAGVDVTLDEPTLWVGYALTPADVVNLRDRVARPETISPASVALRWTLAGPDGGAAVPGGAGLVDGSATGLDLTSASGGAPTYRGGVLAYTLLDQGCSAMVAPSGEGIVFKFHDAATNPVNVTNVVANNESQSVTLAGNPAGGHFTLGFRGQTTAPIPTYVAPPAVYFQWNKADLAPGSYDLAVNYPQFGSCSPSVLYEVLDDAAIVGTFTLNQAGDDGRLGGPVNPASFADPVLVQRGDSGTGNGVPISWYPIGRYAISTGKLRVRVSCPAPTETLLNWFYVDNLRVATTDGGAVALVSTKYPPATGVPEPIYFARFDSRFQVHPEADGTQTWGLPGLGAGIRHLVDPAACRSALEALPGIGAGNVTVTGEGDSLGPLVVTFTGALGGVPQSLLTATDGVVSVAEVAVGGILPSIRINGGPAIPLSHEWLYYNSVVPIMPTVEFFFPQAPPAVTYSVAQTYDHVLSRNGGGWTPIIYLGDYQVGYQKLGYSGQTQISSGPQPTATYNYKVLAAGTYRISATWPAAAGFTTDAVYTVTNRAGRTLATVYTDQTVAPVGEVDRSVPWQVLGAFTLTGFTDGLVVVQSNGTSSPMVADAIRLERTSADDSIRIRPGDVVTYSAGPGWATSRAGPAPASTDAPVANLSGAALYPALPTTATMKIGWNIPALGQQISVPNYANMARNIYAFFAPDEDADGYPTLISGPAIGTSITFSPPSYGADSRAWPALPPRDWVMIWDGASDATLNNQSYTVGELPGAIFPAPGNVGNTRYFRASASPYYYGGDLAITIRGTTPAGNGNYHVDFRNLRIYPVGTDLDNPPKFSPDYLSKEMGCQVGRSVDPLGAITANPTHFTDYNPPQSRLSRNAPVVVISNRIAQIRQYTGDELTFDTAQGVAFEFTVAGPSHGLSMGQYFLLHNYSGPPATLSDGSTFDFSYSAGVLWTLSDPRKFIFFQGPHGSLTMTNVITDPGGTVDVQRGTGFPLQDIVERHNAIGADLYFNTSFQATDACLTELGTYLAENLGRGLKLRVECSNETWNFSSPTYNFASNGSFVFHGQGSQDPVPFMMETARRHWALMEAAWVAAGRDAGDFLRVVGTRGSDTGYTGQIASYAAAHSVGFDELAVGPYLENSPLFAYGEPRSAAIIDILTPAQLLDMWEVHYTYGGYEGQVTQHINVLDQYGLAGVEMIAYEGGPEHPLLYGGEAPAPNWGYRQHAVLRHPRYYGILLHIFRVYQDAGLKAFHVFQLSGTDRVEADGYSVAGWAAYTGSAQLPYVPGDPVQDAIQVNTPDRLDLIRSVTGGAVKTWASLVSAPSTPPPPPSTTVKRPGRLAPARNPNASTRMPFAQPPNYRPFR